VTVTSAPLIHAVDGLMLGEDVHAGIDQVELDDFRRILSTGGEQFLATVYTDGERDHCGGRLERLAARFAAKEAATKALGTGLRGIGPREIEVVSEPNGRPRLRLVGRAHDRAQVLGITSLSLSLTHTESAALALVVARANPRTTTEPAMSLPKESRL
jgi:holo-[acyl-carrier protein] synthase